MNKTSAIRTIIDATRAEPVVFTTEAACRIAHRIADRSNHLYVAESAGMASSLGIGIAMQLRRPAVVVDSYSDLARNPMGLITAGALGGLPLVHVVLDDGLFGAAHGAGSASARADLCALARAAGYASVSSTARLDRFSALVRHQVATCAGPVLIRCLLSEPDHPVDGVERGDLPSHAMRFHQEIADTGDLRRSA